MIPVVGVMLEQLFDGHVEIDPAASLDETLKRLPARWCVYCFADGDCRPVQLLCVKNLRASVQRRLSMVELPGEPSRRINYREVVRHVFFRRVESVLEQDLLYQDAARVLFPSQYRGLVPDRPAWFVHVDPDSTHPRFRTVSDPRESRGRLFGPMAEKQDAAALVESLEELFDLCRYHHLLVQSPNARACPYKDMGRCPAPCDGSITLDAYRALIQLAIDFLDDPGTMIAEQERRMGEAAAELLFEEAAATRKLVEEMKELTRGPYRWLRPIESFSFVVVQRGPRSRTAKLLMVTPGGCEHVVSLSWSGREVGGNLADVVDALRATGKRLPRLPRDERSVERLACVAQHLPKGTGKASAVFIPLADCGERTLRSALRELGKQPVEAGPSADDEGVVRESATA